MIPVYMEKRAVVVGGTSGIGKEVVHILVREGWKVGVAGRREGLLRALEDEHPGHVVTEVIDVTEDDARDRLAMLIEKLGGMDLFLQSSGAGNQNRELERGIEERTVMTNVYGFTMMVDAAFLWFSGHGGKGQLAAISSVAGCRGIGVSASYSATKRFQWTYLQALSQLARSKGLDISISDIRPGFVSTDFIHADYPMQMRPDYVAERIVRGLKRRRRVIVVDWRYHVLLWLSRLIPDFVWERIRL